MQGLLQLLVLLQPSAQVQPFPHQGKRQVQHLRVGTGKASAASLLLPCWL
jgi:hypothetical protein